MDAPLHSQLTLRAMCATSLNARSVVVLSNRMCLFGRADTCDVILDSAATPGLTSRQHAQISFDRGGNCAFVLRDMKSTNGTFHNDTRIVEAVLRQGDRVIFGVKGGNKISIGSSGKFPDPEFAYLVESIEAVHSPSATSTSTASTIRKRTLDEAESAAARQAFHFAHASSSSVSRPGKAVRIATDAEENLRDRNAHEAREAAKRTNELKEEEERQAKVLADFKIRRDQEEAFLADARAKREHEQIEADRQLRDIESRKIELEQQLLLVQSLSEQHQSKRVETEQKLLTERALLDAEQQRLAALEAEQNALAVKAQADARARIEEAAQAQADAEKRRVEIEAERDSFRELARAREKELSDALETARLEAERQKQKHAEDLEAELERFRAETAEANRKEREKQEVQQRTALEMNSSNQRARTEKIAEHLECPICLDYFKDPVTLGCSHSFCLKCIEGWCVKGGKTCPEDRSPIVSMVPSLIIKKMVELAQAQLADEGQRFMASVVTSDVDDSVSSAASSSSSMSSSSFSSSSIAISAAPAAGASVAAAAVQSEPILIDNDDVYIDLSNEEPEAEAQPVEIIPPLVKGVVDALVLCFECDLLGTIRPPALQGFRKSFDQAPIDFRVSCLRAFVQVLADRKQLKPNQRAILASAVRDARTAVRSANQADFESWWQKMRVTLAAKHPAIQPSSYL